MKTCLRVWLLASVLVAPALIGCGGETNKAPEGTGLQGMEDPSTMMPPEPDPAAGAGADTGAATTQP